MGEVKEPYEGGTGSLLEVVDMSSLPIFRKKENRQKMILTGSK